MSSQLFHVRLYFFNSMDYFLVASGERNSINWVQGQFSVGTNSTDHPNHAQLSHPPKSLHWMFTLNSELRAEVCGVCLLLILFYLVLSFHMFITTKIDTNLSSLEGQRLGWPARVLGRISTLDLVVIRDVKLGDDHKRR